MYREDTFYADKDFVYWSITLTDGNKDGFENFSTRFLRLYPGYILDSTMRIRVGPTTRTVNLKQLIKLFNSNDEDLWRNNAWIFEEELKFLDGKIIDGNKVGFQSFPRSGNTFLRKYFKLLTGVETGSD